MNYTAGDTRYVDWVLGYLDPRHATFIEYGFPMRMHAFVKVLVHETRGMMFQGAEKIIEGTKLFPTACAKNVTLKSPFVLRFIRLKNVSNNLCLERLNRIC